MATSTRTASNRPDIYSRITDRIIADLERGVRPWMRPWNAEHAAGRITRPLRHNGIPYKGINVIMLWSAVSDALRPFYRVLGKSADLAET